MALHVDGRTVALYIGAKWGTYQRTMVIHMIHAEVCGKVAFRPGACDWLPTKMVSHGHPCFRTAATPFIFEQIASGTVGDRAR